MCLLCVEIQKGNMTIKETARAYMELEKSDHEKEILKIITEKYSEDDSVELFTEMFKYLK